ncbi:MAG: portal protein, partial [Sulfurospirillaceae bacterium]|nr:portal protein [Sulfurospirillaceae bacterium]
FEKMKLSHELEKLIDSIVESGEATLFIGWETKQKEIRRKSLQADAPYQRISEVTYDGPIVKYIPPEDFVFDVELKNAWDKCPKIFRSYQDLDEICSNSLNNNLTKSAQERLIKLLDDKDNTKKAKKGSQLEILEFWGDFKLDNKTTLKNYIITVAGRNSIIRIEPNPFVINPFVYGNIIEDPETARGMSPLKVAIPINTIASAIINKQMDALSLMVNPPYLAPKGCFKGEQAVQPGKIIEYDAALMPQAPIALKFDSALRGWDFINYFKSSIESATGIYRNMSGNLSAQQRTATELTYSLNGQATRLSMIIDAINRKLIIPMVEKTADIISNFKFGNEKIILKTSQGTTFLTVNDDIRSSNYFYRYGDRKATLERKYRFKEMFDVVSAFSKIAEVNQKINWVECFKFALEQYGIENSDNYLKADIPTAQEPQGKTA